MVLPQGSRRYRVSVGGGLLLEVDPAGGKYWLWRHRFPPTKDGRRQDLPIGPHHRISLKAARDIRDEQKRLLYADGIHPCDAKKRSKDQRWGNHARLTFEAVALDWHATKTADTWTERHSDDVLKKLNKDIFPAIGGMAIDASTAQDCLAVPQVLDDAVAIGHCTIHPAHSLKRMGIDLLDRGRLNAPPLADRPHNKAGPSPGRLLLVGDQRLAAGSLNAPWIRCSIHASRSS